MKKSKIDVIIEPVNRFIHLEYTSGIILFASVILAIVWVNSPWQSLYHHLWEYRFSVGFVGKVLDEPLHIWINDGLMAVFFFLIGLELKREFIAGELSSIKKASLPMVAAIGGMLVPALIYYFFNKNLASANGWGIPMATDIAFALGILSLAGNKVPGSVKVFLSALAVADDLGAVLVIAFFYSSHISMLNLTIAAVLVLLLWCGNLAGVRHTLFYIVAGLAVWVAFLLSGVHATIAGVLVAFTIPARTKIDEKAYSAQLKILAEQFEAEIPNNSILTTPEQHETIQEIKELSIDAETPLQKIESGLHPWVAFLIMPVFALANAGMVIQTDFFKTLLNPVSMGISAGLVIGKFTGVLFFTWLMIRFKLAVLPKNSTWKHITGVALLAGVGFTMSLFITSLAFSDEVMITEAKYGILLASVIAGILGITVLKSRNPSV